MSRRAEAGFILSETLIALTISAMAITLFLAAASAVLDRVERAGQRAAAALLAERLVAEARIAAAGCPLEREGERDGMAWRLEIVCVAEPDPPAFLGLSKMDVAVRWRERSEPSWLRFETYDWVLSDAS